MLILSLLLWRYFFSKRQVDPGIQIRSDKKYSVVFWDFDRPLSDKESYYEELLREIRLFNQDFPNIKVEVKLFPWNQGEQVATAIHRRQDLPDVLSTGPIESLDFPREILLPASYFTEEDFKEYVPLAIDGSKTSQQLTFWPRHLAPQLYLANTELLQAVGVAPEELQQEGVGWDDILDLGPKLSQLPNRPFVLAGLDYQGLLLAVAPRELNESLAASSNWPRNAAVIATARLRQLEEQSFLPKNIVEKGYSGIGEFFAGQAALLAPAEPWLLRAVKDRCGQIGRGVLEPTDKKLFPVVLVPPKSTPSSGLPARVEKLVVFRRRRAADEIKAAVEFARHLSQSGRLAAKLDVLPVHRFSRYAWSEAWELENMGVLLEVCEHSRILAPYPYTELEGKGN